MLAPDGETHEALRMELMKCDSSASMFVRSWAAEGDCWNEMFMLDCGGSERGLLWKYFIVSGVGVCEGSRS